MSDSGASDRDGGGGRLRRVAGLHATAVGDDLFLVREADREIIHLNATARALWQALAEPATAAELSDLLASAYEGAPPARVAADVQAALAEMSALGVIEAVPVGPAAPAATPSAE
ncbi:MAG: PqqD family protein [Alphaproteobacteria bacterium]